MTFEASLIKSIEDGFKKMAEEIFEENKKRMIAELDEKKAEFVAGVAIRFAEFTHYHMNERELVITVRTDKRSANG